DRAAQLGYEKIAITDRNTLAGIVRAHAAARSKGVHFIPGCRLELLDGPSLLAYPTDKDAYGRLSSLLTQGNLRTEKGKCHLYKADVYAYAKGLKFIVVPPIKLEKDYNFDQEFIKALKEYKEALGGNLYLGANFSYNGDDHKRL